MDWTCLLYYILACLGGAVLSWLLFGNKSKFQETEDALTREKNANATLLKDFSDFRMDAKAKVHTKDAEISLLKKKLEEHKRIHSNGNTSDEIRKWKQQAKELEAKLISSSKSGGSESKIVSTLRAQLAQKDQLLKEKEAELKKTKGPLPLFGSKMSQLQEEELTLLTKQVAEQKKKIKKLKKQLNSSTSNHEIETLIRYLKKKAKKKKAKKKS
jgi:uncharacterized coiled-coil protein SlyX